MILSARRHELAVFAELYHPYCSVVVLQLDRLLESKVIQILISLFVGFGPNSRVEKLTRSARMCLIARHIDLLVLNCLLLTGESSLSHQIIL